MRKNLKEEPLPQLNKGSQRPAQPVQVKSKQMEKIRIVAQSMSALVVKLDELESHPNGESFATKSITDIKKLIKSAQLKFLKEYVVLYK